MILVPRRVRLVHTARSPKRVSFKIFVVFLKIIKKPISRIWNTKPLSFFLQMLQHVSPVPLGLQLTPQPARATLVPTDPPANCAMTAVTGHSPDILIWISVLCVRGRWWMVVRSMNRPNQKLLVPDWLITSHVT